MILQLGDGQEPFDQGALAFLREEEVTRQAVRVEALHRASAAQLN